MNLLAPKPKAPPPIAPPAPMPTVDDEAVKRAQKQAAAQQVMRSGRASTIMTNQSSASGASPSQSSTMGG